jgi:hypothetical protein
MEIRGKMKDLEREISKRDAQIEAQKSKWYDIAELKKNLLGKLIMKGMISFHVHYSFTFNTYLMVHSNTNECMDDADAMLNLKEAQMDLTRAIATRSDVPYDLMQLIHWYSEMFANEAREDEQKKWKELLEEKIKGEEEGEERDWEKQLYERDLEIEDLREMLAKRQDIEECETQTDDIDWSTEATVNVAIQATIETADSACEAMLLPRGDKWSVRSGSVRSLEHQSSTASFLRMRKRMDARGGRDSDLQRQESTVDTSVKDQTRDVDVDDHITSNASEEKEAETELITSHTEEKETIEKETIETDPTEEDVLSEMFGGHDIGVQVDVSELAGAINAPYRVHGHERNISLSKLDGYSEDESPQTAKSEPPDVLDVGDELLSVQEVESMHQHSYSECVFIQFIWESITRRTFMFSY